MVLRLLSYIKKFNNKEMSRLKMKVLRHSFSYDEGFLMKCL